MRVALRHIALFIAIGVLAGSLASLHAQSDIKGDIYVLDPSKVYSAHLVASPGLTSDVTVFFPTRSGTVLLTGTAGLQGGVAPSTYLFNLGYGSGTGNALGGVLTSAVTDANASATGMEIVATANGTGTSTALKLRGNGATTDNYALEIVEGRIKISSTLPTAVSSSQPLVLEGGEIKIGSVGTLTGSGTTNKIPMWTGGTALGNSMLSQNGGGTVLTVSGSAIVTATTNQLVLGTTNTTTVSATAPAASLTYTMPDVGANADFVLTEGAQTVNGIKTFGSAPNLSSLTARGVLTLDASKNVVSTALTNGQILIGSTGATPTAATLTAGTGITITNGAGSVTITTTVPLPPGTTDNATVRYDLGTNSWVENTFQLVTAGGTMTLPGLTASLPLKLDASKHLISAAIDLTSAIEVAGALPINRGGTNSATALNSDRIMVSNGGAIVEAAALTNGQLLIGSTGGAPTAAALTAGSGITVTNGAGSITIAATNPMPAGTTNNATLRYNSGTSTWVENTNVTATSAGVLNAVSLALSATSNQMVFGTTNTATISASAPGASRTYTIADPGANASFVMTEGAQTMNGVKTFGSAPNLSSLTASGVLGLDASKNITSTTLTNGQILIGSTGSTPVAAALTAGSGITVTNGAGSITIAATNPMPAGTTNNSTLRYNSGTSTWVENTNVTATSAGAVNAVSLALSATSNQMVLGTTNTATISASAPGASRTYTIADPGANASFVMTEGAQTINGVKTFGSAPNLSSLTASGVLGLDASKNITSTALTNGQLLIGSTGAAPVAAALTAGSGITVTNGAGSITIAATNPMPAGTTTDATMRYNGTAWVENTSVKATAAGAVSAATLALSATSNQMVLGTTNTATISASAPGASRTYTIADPGANASFVMTEGAQTMNGVKTFGSAPNLTSLTARGILGLDASKNVTSTALTDGQILIGSTGSTPAAATLTAGTGITITNGAGSISLAVTNPVAAGTTTDATLRWNGTAWVQNTGVLSNGTSLTIPTTTNQLVLGTTRTVTINAVTPATTSRTYTMPDPGADASFVMTESAQTINGNKTLSGTTNLSALTASLPLKLDASKNITAAGINLASSTEVLNTLPINRGGTNSTTTLNNNRIMVSSGGAIVEAGALTNGQILIGSTSAAPVVGSITAGTGISVTNGAGTITIANTAIPAGTTNNSTLRYNSGTSAWVENTSVTATSAGAVTAVSQNLTATTNQLTLGATAGPNIVFTAPAPVATRTYTIPDVSANASFVMTEGAQTINGNKTMSGTTNLSALTASLPLKLDASKNITAAGIDLSSATEVLNSLPANRGGTSFSTYATGDILYASAANTLSKLPIGSNGQFLTIASGVPAWASGSIMQYDVSSAQTSSTTASNFLFNVQYGTITGAATGARIASVTTASNSNATGLAITATGTGTSTATALTLSATGSSTKYALTVADGSGFSGFGTTAPAHVVHSVNSATTDEVSAVLGNATGSTSNQAIGVWGDASNNASANTGSIGVLATGSGRTTTAETNAAIQIADGEIRVGRTTETGTGYTVVEGATAGTDYTAQGPSGVIEINLGTVGGWADNGNITNDKFKITSITLNSRYISTSSIVLLQIIDKVEVTVNNTVNINEVVFTLDIDGRAAGSCSVQIGAQLRSGAANNNNPFSDGDKIRIGYMIVNPSK